MSTEIHEVIGFSDEQIQRLEAPLDATLIRQRPDGKKYLKGSTEIDAANRIFGFGKWGYKIISRTLQKAYDLDDRVVGFYFYVEVELYVAGAMFPFYGDGGQVVTDRTAQGYENASKGATTDALKRALRHYGDQMGLCLYDEDSYVDIGDGVLAQVKQVNPTALQQKRVVDGKASKQIVPPKQDIKGRLNTLYPRAKGATCCANPTEFLAFIAFTLGVDIVSANTITWENLNDIEAEIEKRERHLKESA